MPEFCRHDLENNEGAGKAHEESMLTYVTAAVVIGVHYVQRNYETGNNSASAYICHSSGGSYVYYLKKSMTAIKAYAEIERVRAVSFLCISVGGVPVSGEKFSAATSRQSTRHDCADDTYTHIYVFFVIFSLLFARPPPAPHPPRSVSLNTNDEVRSEPEQMSRVCGESGSWGGRK